MKLAYAKPFKRPNARNVQIRLKLLLCQHKCYNVVRFSKLQRETYGLNMHCGLSMFNNDFNFKDQQKSGNFSTSTANFN